MATVQFQVTRQDEQRLAQARPVLSRTSLVLLVALLLMPIGLVLGFFLMRRVEPIRDFDLTESTP